MAEEKTVTTTAAETGEKPEAAEGTVQEKPEAAARTYNQAYVDDLIERQKAAQEAAVAEALKVAGMDKDAKANADAFKTKFDAAVQAQVEKRLAGKTPQGGNGSQSGTSMKSEIEKYMA